MDVGGIPQFRHDGINGRENMRKLITACAVLMSMTVGAYAATIGDDGLHKAPWMRDTFKDLQEDLEEANASTARRCMKKSFLLRK